jgi:hypothetical protein
MLKLVLVVTLSLLRSLRSLHNQKAAFLVESSVQFVQSQL